MTSRSANFGIRSAACCVVLCINAAISNESSCFINAAISNGLLRNECINTAIGNESSCSLMKQLIMNHHVMDFLIQQFVMNHHISLMKQLVMDYQVMNALMQQLMMKHHSFSEVEYRYAYQISHLVRLCVEA